MIPTIANAAILAILSLVVFCVTGCSSITAPWEESSIASRNHPPIVVLSTFDDPPFSAIGIGDVGSGFTAALRERLAIRTDISLRTDEAVANDVRRTLLIARANSSNEMSSLRQRWPGTRYVVIGRITDFKHVTMSPNDLSKWGADRNRNQAIATLTLTIVDLELEQTTNEQLNAQAWSSSAAVDQLYRGVKFGSTRFWDTPLGLASRDLIGQTVSTIERVIPGQQSLPIRIVQALSDRRVRLASDADTRCSPGEMFYVCQYDSSGTQLQVIKDKSTNLPLTAKIESRGLYPSAWLMGEPQSSANLSQAVLSRTQP